MLNTPVVFIIFNRTSTAQRVFDKIRQARPQKLLVIADGPRIDRIGEVERCMATRAIIQQVDWDCEVICNYSEINLGCRQRISSGLDWAFNLVEEAIILEDDCLPDPTFFRFCEELLDCYRHNERVFTISGQNVQFHRRRGNYSYYFSHYFHCWGWATWRRAWQYQDIKLQSLPSVLASDQLQDLLQDARAVEYWTRIFQEVVDNQIDTWDYQFLLNSWIQGGLHALSNVNLISNIGFGASSTNTAHSESIYANLPTEAIQFPLEHPPMIVRHKPADDFTQNTLFNPTIPVRVRSKINRALGKQLI